MTRNWTSATPSAEPSPGVYAPFRISKDEQINIHFPLTPLWAGGAGGAPGGGVEMADWYPSWSLCQAPRSSLWVSGQSKDVRVLLSMLRQRE